MGARLEKPRELARITAAPARRAIGVGALGGIGAVMLWVGLTAPPEALGWLAFLLVGGAGALWAAAHMWRATGGAVVLTEDGLFTERGEEIAPLDGIEKLDRGLFALKPSNGFGVVLRRPGRGAWVPGLWWRLGRRVAIGGVAPGSMTRPVADLIEMKLAERAGR